jgi:hypothetical protein
MVDIRRRIEICPRERTGGSALLQGKYKGAHLIKLLLPYEFNLEEGMGGWATSYYGRSVDLPLG